MDDVERIELINLTSNRTEWNRYEESSILTTYQIFALIWGVIFIIPAIILVKILVKNTLHQGSNFYFVILHWSIANLIFIVGLFPDALVPEQYLFKQFLDFSFVFGILVRFIPVIFGVFFVFDKFVKSKNVCIYTIYAVWIIFGILITIATILISINIWKVTMYIALALMVSQLLFFIIIVVKSVLYCRQGSDEETSKWRLIIVLTYVITSCLQWIFVYILAFESISIDIIGYVSTFLVYGNSLINLIVLTFYDPRFKTYLLELFRRDSAYQNVHFSRKESTLATIEEDLEQVLVH